METKPLTNIQAKTYDFSTVAGITLNQLQQHYKLYVGYVNKLNEIWNTTNDANSFPDSNATYSKMRSLKLGETYALDGVKLHELYFENICGDAKVPYGDILELINKSYGNYDNFIKYLKEVGLSMRGWAVVAIDPLDEKLHIFGSDAHDVGAVWMSHPIIVMDVYEHSYMIDFGIDRKRYIDLFIKNINWEVLNKRLKSHYEMTGSRNYQRSTVMPLYYPIWGI